MYHRHVHRNDTFQRVVLQSLEDVVIILIVSSLMHCARCILRNPCSYPCTVSLLEAGPLRLAAYVVDIMLGQGPRQIIAFVAVLLCLLEGAVLGHVAKKDKHV